MVLPSLSWDERRGSPVTSPSPGLMYEEVAFGEEEHKWRRVCLGKTVGLGGRLLAGLRGGRLLSAERVGWVRGQWSPYLKVPTQEVAGYYQYLQATAFQFLTKVGLATFAS